MPIKRTKPLPRVALVGRTNVGKSTLWNLLTESTQALVSDKPHTTRDRKYGTVIWKGLAFELIDTGGMDTEKDEVGEGILKQAKEAVKDADLVVFVVDTRAGLLPFDKELATAIRKLGKPVWLAANKTDSIKYIGEAQSPDFMSLGFGEAFPVSATTSLGIGDFLDAIQKELKRIGVPAVEKKEVVPLRIALIGRPNVGKSSIVNKILGEERVIVSPRAHTTREPQDTAFTYKGRDIVLIDTAGMRRRSKIKGNLEEEGIRRNRQVLKRADVALLVFDSTEDPTKQDRKLAGLVAESDTGLILVANKWDLVDEKETYTAKTYETLIRQLFPFLDWAPMVFVSALTGKRMTRLIDLAIKVETERHRHIDYNAANRILKSTIQAKRPLQAYGPKSPRIYDVAQVGHAPPRFLLTVHGEKENLHENWMKFFAKRLRVKFGFQGTPLQVVARHVPLAKSKKKYNVSGPGMEAVAGPVKEKKRKVNQTRRRQKKGSHRY